MCLGLSLMVTLIWTFVIFSIKKKLLSFSLLLFLLSCGDGDSIEDVKNLREEVIERYDGGDKKVVGYYYGEGSNEVIVKRVHYYSQNDGGEKEKEENYKNGKLEGKYLEWLNKGDKSVEYNYKNGELDGDFKIWYGNELWRHWIYKDGEIIEEIK